MLPRLLSEGRQLRVIVFGEKATEVVGYPRRDKWGRAISLTWK